MFHSSHHDPIGKYSDHSQLNTWINRLSAYRNLISSFDLHLISAWSPALIFCLFPRAFQSIVSVPLPCLSELDIVILKGQRSICYQTGGDLKKCIQWHRIYFLAQCYVRWNLSHRLHCCHQVLFELLKMLWKIECVKISQWRFLGRKKRGNVQFKTRKTRHCKW